MKKILAMALLVCLGVGTASAEFKYGIKAGLNVNRLHFNQKILDNSNSCGWEAGAVVDFTIPIIGLAFDASVMYQRMNNGNVLNEGTPATITTPGTNPSPSVGGSNITSTPSSDNLFGKNFLEIPINIKYKFSLPVVGSFLSPYVFTGPSFGIRLDKKAVKAAVESRSCQVAWNVGLGLELVKHVQVGASYGFGINNIVKAVPGAGINPTDEKVRNNYWSVTAAYLF